MYENVCRACLGNSSEMIPIFDELYNGLSLVKIYENLSSMEVKKCDKVTKLLCQQCLNDLKNCFDFQQKCIKSYKIITKNESIQENLDEKFNDSCGESYGIVSESNTKSLLKCENFDEKFNDTFKESLENTSGSNTKSILKCEICHKVYRLQKLFDKHIQSHNKNKKKDELQILHICVYCNKEFPYKSFLVEHMKNHTGEKPYLCSICGKGFRQKGGLGYHIRYHTGHKPFFCNVCNMSFVSQNILKVHMRRHTDERPYVCDICGRAFRQNTDMRTHRQTQHTLNNDDNRLNQQSTIECSVCNKRLTRSGALTVHMRIHTGERPFKCDTCNKGFVTRSLMLRHKRIHTKERPYICKVCERGFSQSSSLNTHMKTHNKVLKKSVTF